MRTLLAEARLPKDERRAARMERLVEEQMRRERDNKYSAERRAARRDAEARKYSNAPWAQ